MLHEQSSGSTNMVCWQRRHHTNTSGVSWLSGQWSAWSTSLRKPQTSNPNLTGSHTRA